MKFENLKDNAYKMYCILDMGKYIAIYDSANLIIYNSKQVTFMNPLKLSVIKTLDKERILLIYANYNIAKFNCKTLTFEKESKIEADYFSQIIILESNIIAFKVSNFNKPGKPAAEYSIMFLDTNTFTWLKSSTYTTNNEILHVCQLSDNHLGIEEKNPYTIKILNIKYCYIEMSFTGYTSPMKYIHVYDNFLVTLEENLLRLWNSSKGNCIMENPCNIDNMKYLDSNRVYYLDSKNKHIEIKTLKIV